MGILLAWRMVQGRTKRLKLSWRRRLMYSWGTRQQKESSVLLQHRLAGLCARDAICLGRCAGVHSHALACLHSVRILSHRLPRALLTANGTEIKLAVVEIKPVKQLNWVVWNSGSIHRARTRDLT